MGKFFSAIFGLASLMGFILAAFTFVKSLESIENIKDEVQFYGQFVEIFKTLSFTIFAFIVLLLVVIMYYTKRVDKLENQLEDLPVQYDILTNEYNTIVAEANYHVFISKLASECNHNIFHFCRNILASSDRIINRARTDVKPPSDDELIHYFNDFDLFLGTSLSNISNFLTTKTKDQCSACVKILKGNEYRNFYRDPISYRFRREADYFPDGSFRTFLIEDNYAINIITDSKVKYLTFQCDDLLRNGNYKNPVDGWENLYNAIMVVPIAINLKDSKRIKREVKGIICVDNFKGGFENKEVLDFLCSFGDMLYNLFAKYEIMVNLPKNKGAIKNERFKIFTDW